MIEKINRLREEIEALSATKAEELENLRIKYLSKKGEVSQLFNDFRNVAAENKREIGQRLNELKEIATEKINSLREALNEKSEADNTIDLTRTAYPIPLGTRHPISLVRNEICDIFGRLGFSIAEGPEVEDDWHVFSALNFAEDHPARDMQDTFFIQRSPDVLLRTHTSSVQTRVMEHAQPPIRIICPKRCSVPRQRYASALLTSRLPNPVPKWIFHATSAGGKAVLSVNIRGGSKFWAAGWLIPMFLKHAASIVKPTPVMLSEWE